MFADSAFGRYDIPRIRPSDPVLPRTGAGLGCIRSGEWRPKSPRELRMTQSPASRTNAHSSLWVLSSLGKSDSPVKTADKVQIISSAECQLPAL